MKDELLQRIARYLMLHGSFTSNIGILNGKMGIAIFFYHYSIYSGKRIYADFAGEIIDEIYKEINVNTVLNFKDGLCGIAWGFGYLIQNGFVEANSDDVLEDLDSRIMEWDVRRITDYSLETGLVGISCYVISRMENREKKNVYINQEYIFDLIEALKRKKEKIDTDLMDAMGYIFIRHCERSEAIQNSPVIGRRNEETIRTFNPINRIIEKTRYDSKTIFETSRALGIDKSGYAGIGLQLMEVNKQ